MDAAKSDRDLNMPAWRRWTLLAALLTLGLAYISAYAFYRTHSVDFISGERNERALEFSRNHAIRLPTTLLFASESSNLGSLGGGWHRPEPQGIWSSAADSWIEVAMQPVAADVLLRVHCKAFVAGRKRQMHIALDVNGQNLGSWLRDNTNADAPLEVRVPKALAATRNLAIHLHLDHVASPLVLRVGQDGRHLGVFLTSIDLEDADSDRD